MTDRIHELKTWPEPFSALMDGRKRFELRKGGRFGLPPDLCVMGLQQDESTP